MGRAKRRREARRAPAGGVPRVREEGPRQVLLLVAVGLVILAAVGVAVFGYYQTQIATGHKTIIEVGETKVSLGHFERRLRSLLSTSPTLRQSPGNAVPVVFTLLEREAVLQEGAPRIGIDASEEDVDAEILRRLGLPEEGDPRLFADRYGEAVSESGLHTDEYRSWVRASVLEDGMREKYRAKVPSAETQVRARLIRVQTEEEAQGVIGRLEAGEEFASLAEELSLDQTTKEQGGETDWLLRGEMEESVDEFLFTAEVGARSGPLSAANAYFVAELLERQDERELSARQREIVADGFYEEWIQAATVSLEVVRSLEPEDEMEALINALKGLGASTPAAGESGIPISIGGGQDEE